MKKIKNIISKHPLLSILTLSLLIRLLLSPFGTLKLDQNTFIAWSTTLSSLGTKAFYQSTWSDYFPGYLYVLLLLKKISLVFTINSTLLYKLPAICTDLATITLIYKITSNLTPKKATLAAFLYAINPAIIINSTLWGQVDALPSFFSLLCLFLLPNHVMLSALSLSAGTLIKPQAAFILPVALIVLYMSSQRKKQITLFLSIFTLAFLTSFLPFFNVNSSLPTNLFHQITSSLNQYPYTSINAFNFWALFGFWQQDNSILLSPQRLGFLFVSILFLFAFTNAPKEKKGTFKYTLSAFVFLTTFLFFTRMHERHLFPIFAPLAILSINSSKTKKAYLIFSLTYSLNLLYAHFWISNNFHQIFSPQVVKTISLVNILTFLFFFKNSFLFKKNPLSSLKFTLSKSHPKNPLLWILAFAALSRFLFLSSPPSEYFDEVYHAFTARRMLSGDPKAWEWWNTSPEGFAFEWTHPPMAKLIMVLGMLVFGENSFGWRAPSALLGTFTIFLVYKIAFHLTNKKTALLSAFLFSIDGLPLVMSRLGMNDAYFLFFLLLCFYFFLKDKHLLSALALGLSLSSKWSTFWILPLLFVAHFSLKKKATKKYLYYICLPPLVYFASYLPMFAHKHHTLSTFIEVQKQMWWYHTGLDATHPYQSTPLSWPLMIRPVWLFVEYGTTSIKNIYAQGNPAIFWLGLLCVPIAFWESFTKKNKKLALVIFAYLVFFLPWSLSPRIMFLYHYLPSIPFLTIILAQTLTKNKKIIFPTLFVSTLLFLYFYPHLVGLSVPKWLNNTYFWLNSWK
jgi:predicted membrane-bound dolichyl-phosphate-mannose-protein mannosyltransferase